MDAHALILEHMPLADRLAAAHARRTGADFDEVRSDAHLVEVVGVKKWLESDRSVELKRWIVMRVVMTMKDEWRLRQGLQHRVPNPQHASIHEMAEFGWEPPGDEAGYQAVDDRQYLAWLAEEARACPDMSLAVAAVFTPQEELAAVQDPPVTASRICQRIRKGRVKLRALADQHHRRAA